MSNESHPIANEPLNSGQQGVGSSALLGTLAASLGMIGRIEDTEDMEAKEAAFDEMMAGKWTAMYARELKAGHKIRDAAGDAVEITGVYPSANEHVYVTTKDRLGMHIPKTGLVLVVPNAALSSGRKAHENL